MNDYHLSIISGSFDLHKKFGDAFSGTINGGGALLSCGAAVFECNECHAPVLVATKKRSNKSQ